MSYAAMMEKPFTVSAVKPIIIILSAKDVA
jgi:hypothetical protein